MEKVISLKQSSVTGNSPYRVHATRRVLLQPSPPLSSSPRRTKLPPIGETNRLKAVFCSGNMMGGATLNVLSHDIVDTYVPAPALPGALKFVMRVCKFKICTAALCSCILWTNIPFLNIISKSKDTVRVDSLPHSKGWKKSSIKSKKSKSFVKGLKILNPQSFLRGLEIHHQILSPIL